MPTCTHVLRCLSILCLISGSTFAQNRSLLAEDLELRNPEVAALAQQGTTSAWTSLQSLEVANADDWRARAALGDAMLLLAQSAMDHDDRGIALEAYQHLLKTRQTPSDTYLRCAAIHNLSRDFGIPALPAILKLAASPNSQIACAAVQAAVDVPGEEATEKCIWEYQIGDDAARIAILRVLGQRDGDAALETLNLALQDPEKVVRLAAIEALANFPHHDAATALIAHHVGLLEPAERFAVEDALVNRKGDHVDKLVVEGLAPDTTYAAREPSVAGLLEVLARRAPASGAEEEFTAFLYLEDLSPAVRAAAWRAMGTIGSPTTVAKLTDEVDPTAEPAERTLAVEAITTICRRGTDDPSVRQSILVTAREAKRTNDAQQYGVCLRVLGRLGENAVLPMIESSLTEGSAEAASDAFDALAHWPNADAAPLLRQHLPNTRGDQYAQGLRAYVHLLTQSPDAPEEWTGSLQDAITLARDADEKRMIIQHIGETGMPAALPFLEAHFDDEVLRPAAVDACLSVIDAMIPADWQNAGAPLDRLAAMRDQLPMTQRFRLMSVRERFEEFEGYIVDWWVAGPYTEEGKRGVDLWDRAFPPEESFTAGRNWRSQSPTTDGPYAGWGIDLHATMAGDNRVGYMFTTIHADAETAARLELGSDDGIKVWVNGTLVHANNALRGVTRGDDTLDIHLEQGWNTLLLKISNDTGGWGACARLRSVDNGPLESIRVHRGANPNNLKTCPHERKPSGCAPGS